jgi:hypothetical protein
MLVNAMQLQLAKVTLPSPQAIHYPTKYNAMKYPDDSVGKEGQVPFHCSKLTSTGYCYHPLQRTVAIWRILQS